MTQETTQPIAIFDGYIDGEPHVRWLDRNRMPQAGDRLCVAAEQPSVLTNEQIIEICNKEGLGPCLGLDVGRAIERAAIAAHIGRDSGQGGELARVSTLASQSQAARPSDDVKPSRLTAEAIEQIGLSHGIDAFLNAEHRGGLGRDMTWPEKDLYQREVTFARAIERAAAAVQSQAAPVRPTDDGLWDATLRDRDTYHGWADKLAEAIAKHFGVDIGEHSNVNCPWAEALEVIEQAAPVAEAVPDLHHAIMNLPCKRTMSHFPDRGEMLAYKEGFRDARHAAAELAIGAEAAQAVTQQAAKGRQQNLSHRNHVGAGLRLAEAIAKEQIDAAQQAATGAREVQSLGDIVREAMERGILPAGHQAAKAEAGGVQAAFRSHVGAIATDDAVGPYVKFRFCTMAEADAALEWVVSGLAPTTSTVSAPDEIRNAALEQAARRVEADCIGFAHDDAQLNDIARDIRALKRTAAQAAADQD